MVRLQYKEKKKNMLFKYNHQNLIPISENRFDLEKDIQALAEKNLQAIFGLKFITSEFALNNLRIDTLAFDEESNSFVIIEYKRDRNISIIDQGYAYLSLLINNKADFILHYNETQTKPLKKDDIDWSQTRVIFIAHSYTAHQRQAINFADMPIELWKVAKYEGNIVEFDRLETAETSESIKTFSKTSGVVQKVSKEIKKYTIEDHLKYANPKTKKLFELLNEKILQLGDNIIVEPKKCYIAYKINKNFVDITPMLKTFTYLRIFLNIPSGKLKDPYNIARDLAKPKKIGHWGNGDYDVVVKKEEDIDKVFELIKQSYNYNK